MRIGKIISWDQVVFLWVGILDPHPMHGKGSGFCQQKNILVTLSNKSKCFFLFRLISHLVSSHPGAGACIYQGLILQPLPCGFLARVFVTLPKPPSSTL